MQRSDKMQDSNKQTQSSKKPHPCDPNAIVDNIIDEYVKKLREPNQTLDDKDLLSKLLGVDFDTKLTPVSETSKHSRINEFQKKNDNYQIPTNDDSSTSTNKANRIPNNVAESSNAIDLHQEERDSPCKIDTDGKKIESDDNSSTKTNKVCWNNVKNLTTLEFTNSKIDRISESPPRSSDRYDMLVDQSCENGFKHELKELLNSLGDENNSGLDYLEYNGCDTYEPKVKVIPKAPVTELRKQFEQTKAMWNKILKEMISMEFKEMALLDEIKQMEETTLNEFREIRLALIKREQSILNDIKQCKESGLTTKTTKKRSK